ncbi:3-oxoacyl-[acyl-carrier-protein] reductase FabG [Methylobacterium crusticola]|uniref:3-oxoacyl-[acyl-carrier-protein] reductase FabG n=1 Tax=Methylobacterium crusticola TaxID=1697972 RepID=A0ABQ4R0F2_9HYPH|nr:SDR family oxidoreductase [Methylobacterium crusticola]GJD50771.1 3-oxoacyl-[acyl-carrier-protein] reductase FabG [Methylobacterium crusticola]
MKIDLSGKTALVTGSTEGIGFAIAKGLHEAGATVVVNGRTQIKVDAAVARLGGQARGQAIDLGNRNGAAALLAAEPAFDILVNNLGIFQPSDFFETNDDVWERHWQVNVMSGVRLARAYLPGMAAKGWGRVLFLGSESAYNIPVEMIHYGVSKTADVSLARGLAKRMAGTGVTVNSILPGPTLSEGVAEMLKDQVPQGKTLEQAGIDFVKALRPTSIIGRPATVEEVANMAVYIASPAASATTGAALRVDGGVIDFIV